MRYFIFLPILASIFLFQSTTNSQINRAIDFDVNSSYNVYTQNYYYPDEEINISVNAYNIEKKPSFNFVIYKIKDVGGFFSRQTAFSVIDVLSKDSINLISMTDEIDSFTKTFKTQGNDDYNYLYETVKFRNHGKGAYLVGVKYKNKIAYTGYFVSELGMITEAANNGMLVFAVDRRSGEPVENVNLTFNLGKRKIGTGSTANGLFFKALEEEDRVYAASNDISYPLVIGKKDDDIVVSDPSLYFGYNYNRYSVYIYTNQPVYRPKLNVQFKGIIRMSSGGEYKNFPSKEINVIIKDPKGAEVYKTILRTNENGSFNGEYTLPDNAPTGTYYIYATIEKDLSYTGTFDVEEYKKPEYKVGITTDKGQYSGKETISGVVQSDYYFGSPVKDAKVVYNIYKKPYYKPWWYFSEYRWWYEDYYSTQEENVRFNDAEFIYSGEGVLDENGRFDFTYNINEDFKFQNPYRMFYHDRETEQFTDYTYIIQAKVTDKSRREISSTSTVNVTRSSYYLVANTDRYIYKPGETVMLTVRAADFSDKPAEVGFEAVVNRITYAYPEYKQEKEYITTVNGRTLSDGQGIVSFNASKEGYYEIKVSSRDDKGNIVTTDAYCYVSTGDMWWWNNQAGGVHIIPDKESYKPGEICRVQIITSEPDVNILLTAQNDNILNYETHRLSKTSMIAEIPVGENFSPNFYINVSYVKNGTFHTQSRSVIVIPDDKFLNVMIGTDKDTYKPKENGTATIRVTDAAGNPVSNAELSLGIVDESVYAIKADNTKDIRKHFYSPKPQTVWSHFNNSNGYYGYSRFLTIYERFNVRSLLESELGTVKGRILNKKREPVSYATIVIDDDFLAGTTDDNGEFIFKLPPGSYKISIIQKKRTSESEDEIEVRRGRITTVNLTADDDVLSINIPAPVAQTEGNMAFDEANVRMAPERSMEELSLKDKRESKGEYDSESFVAAELRSDFRDAIQWMPDVKTDASGMAVLNVQYPDNLTTWRFTSRVITEDTKVGQVVNTVITRKDLLVRMETPRFLQQKDDLIISTIVHNYLNESKSTKISLSGENVEIEGASERTVDIARNEEKRIDWRIKVNEPVGFAKLTATALTNQESDAVEIKVPLQPHGLKISQYASIDISDREKIESKEIRIPQFTDMRSTKVSLNIAPSLASTMITALDQLVGYPYGCVEQTMSRFLPTVIVANSFKDLNAPLNEVTIKELPKMVEAGYGRLYSMQHADGGWGWWTNDQSHPFMTSYVIYGLYLGDAAGYPVNKNVLNKGVTSIKNQLNDLTIDATTRSYMLYSMSYIEKDRELYKKEFDKLLSESINDYALSLLSMTAFNIGDMETSDMINKKLLQNVRSEGESASYWGGQAWHYNWQDDKVQTTAMAVKALVNNPGSLGNNQEILDKAVRWLMMQKQGPAWNSTQETAFIIYAMIDYLKNSKELEPDYMVKVFVNDEMVLDKHMTRADVFQKDMQILIDGNKLRSDLNIIRVEKSGNGKIYVSSQLDYYTSDEIIKPTENGFRVEREYFKLEKYTHYGEDKITYRKRHFDGYLKSGEEILVKIKVYAKDDNLQYFMLEDPLPAGCEVIKDDWAYKIDDEKDYGGYDYYWWRWWYADKEIRDNRVTFFATYLYGKEYEFSYIMRAQIPGEYNVIPAAGMLMYYPEVRGTSSELKVNITD